MPATRFLRTSAFAAALLIGFAVTARAQVIKEYTGGNIVSRVAVTPGVSFLLPAVPNGGSSWTNIAFSWFGTTGGSPLAFGPLFLFSSPYQGEASDLDVNTPGVIAQADTTDGKQYTFSDQIILAGNRTYYLYTTATGDIVGGGSQAGTMFYDSDDGSKYISFTNLAPNYRLTGDVSSSEEFSEADSEPEPGSGPVSSGLASPFAVPEPPAIIFLGIGALGLLGYGWRRGGITP